MTRLAYKLELFGFRVSTAGSFLESRWESFPSRRPLGDFDFLASLGRRLPPGLLFFIGMSSQNPDSPREFLSELLSFCWRQEMKQVHTVMPGVVDSYEGGMATVLPGFRLGLADGDSVRYVDRPPLVDVPVVHPAGGGWKVHLPIKKGDHVLLVFAMRGTEHWKERQTVADEGGSFFGLDSAFAIPMGSTQPAADGMTITDGTTSLSFDQGTVQVKGASVKLVGQVAVTGGLTVNGTRVALAGHDH